MSAKPAVLHTLTKPLHTNVASVQTHIPTNSFYSNYKLDLVDRVSGELAIVIP